MMLGSKTGVSAVYPCSIRPSKPPRTGICFSVSFETIKLMESWERLTTVRFRLSVPLGYTMV